MVLKSTQTAVATAVLAVQDREAAAAVLAVILATAVLAADMLPLQVLAVLTVLAAAAAVDLRGRKTAAAAAALVFKAKDPVARELQPMLRQTPTPMVLAAAVGQAAATVTVLAVQHLLVTVLTAAGKVPAVILVLSPMVQFGLSGLALLANSLQQIRRTFKWQTDFI